MVPPMPRPCPCTNLRRLPIAVQLSCGPLGELRVTADPRMSPAGLELLSAVVGPWAMRPLGTPARPVWPVQPSKASGLLADLAAIRADIFGGGDEGVAR